eukprot:TRINITY_DN7799_c0_g2_i2.p2 TRINITY_DN7799_c0_g2~~TRINITY_DN7799_c0_g2_i2.p2  ORF type:complete len:102 (-),score=3.61 TRINITY_DN7799_c0_g2_i2:1096-1401(-)
MKGVYFRTSWNHFFSGIRIHALTTLDTFSLEIRPLLFLVSFSVSSMFSTIRGVLDEEGVREILKGSFFGWFKSTTGGDLLGARMRGGDKEQEWRRAAERVV